MKYANFAHLVPLLFLAACGGGNSDNNGGNNNPPPSAAMGIDAGNALLVAQVTYQSASSSGDFAGLAGNTGLTGNAGGGLAKPAIGSASIFDAILQVPVGPIELPCAVSGTYTISGDLADPVGGTLTAGDSLAAEYNACDDGVGEVLDGTIEFDVDAISGDITSGAYELTMTMRLINFQSTTAEDVLMANGDGTATINTLAAPYVEASVSGGSMMTDTNASTQTLTLYASAQTVDTGIVPSPFTLTTSGTLDSSDLTGSVTYSTPLMFEGFDANYPHVGQLLIVGDASSARIIAQANAIDVVIEIYSNTTGTGTPDTTINTTWTELAGL
ncbi:MAG: hypothetical protein GTO71_08100 [Woeseiaceae bacterium]|nr:hypothetical protein [Woeseiaceae bacterium]NIP21048.1 hypothetical protein [Woeseiaceae bacterium]NIS90020.1 hypothetical protein [Woeseiaceae bacterium]